MLFFGKAFSKLLANIQISFEGRAIIALRLRPYFATISVAFLVAQTAAEAQTENTLEDAERSAETCETSDASVCADAAIMYSVINPERSVLLYQKGCDAGFALACSNLGVVYQFGMGIEADERKAAEMYQKGCDGKNAGGCTNLGYLYESGIGVTKNANHAAILYQQGCEGGDANGCTNFGFLYQYGIGVAADHDRAAELYLQGCEGGYSVGGANLAKLFWGLGITGVGDKKSANEYFRKACELGDQLSCSRVE